MTVEKGRQSADKETALKDRGTAKMLRCRVRYFTDGAVIGSKKFVNEAFSSARNRFVIQAIDRALTKNQPPKTHSTQPSALHFAPGNSSIQAVKRFQRP